MSKYDGLSEFLAKQYTDSVTLTFDKINDLLPNGNGLPFSAYNHRAWWANTYTSHPYAMSWLANGYQVTYINTSDKVVTFTKTD